LIEKTLRTGRIISRSNGHELLCRDGRKVPIAHTVSPIRDGNEQIIGTVLVIRNITEEKKKQKKIDYLVYHDALTGVYNRRYFDQMLKKIDTEENLPISIINCDVNGLKLTNDAFGHNAGDKLLMRMASVLTKASRPCDIVARSGGDEFMILMPKADENAAQSVCSEIKALAERNSLYAIDCSISVGYDTKKHPDESLKTIINKAEAFMYRNKSSESPYMRGSSINNILSTLHEKFARERLHCSHVSEIGSKIAYAMGLTEREISEIGLIGRMHDIGKIAVNEALFSKPSGLTEEEWIDMRRHPEVGFRILSASTDMASIAKSVLAHHERFDGSGYPNGLKGSSIPIMARILAVADAFEAMTNERPYRTTKSKDEALTEIASLKGTQFDPAIVDIFLKLNH
jgi:diguanylate cyclase (GGDEF)-like protein